MSYILDALKKADADRDRQVSAVPDLHAQADTAARLALAQPRAARWWGLALGVALAVLAGAAWQWLGPSDEAPAPTLATAAPIAVLPVAPPAVIAPAAVAPSPLPPPPPTMTPNATPGAMPPPAGMTQARPRALPQTVPPPVSVPRPPERRVEAAPRARAPGAAPPTQAQAQMPAQIQTPAGAQPQAQAQAPQPALQPSRLPTFAELPPNLRSQLPALAVGGSVYSRTPGSRMVILNGQVFREGDRPMDGLSVDEIRLKSSVLSFRGTRFELPH